MIWDVVVCSCLSLACSFMAFVTVIVYWMIDKKMKQVEEKPQKIEIEGLDRQEEKDEWEQDRAILLDKLSSLDVALYIIKKYGLSLQHRNIVMESDTYNEYLSNFKLYYKELQKDKMLIKCFYERLRKVLRNEY